MVLFHTMRAYLRREMMIMQSCFALSIHSSAVAVLLSLSAIFDRRSPSQCNERQLRQRGGLLFSVAN